MTSDTSLREKALRDEHERIWLEPNPGDDPEGRMWCQDNFWGDEAVEYVRADIAEAARLRIEALEAALRPFAAVAEIILGEAPANSERVQLFEGCDGRKCGVTLDALRRARAALSGKEGQS